jgi:hypothetical protein
LLAILISALAAANPGVTLRPEDLRVASITYRLALEGAGYCSDPFPLTGLVLHHLPEYEADDRPSQVQRHRLDRGPGVLAVVADSPAARAGLAPGDVVLSINGRPLPDPREMASEFEARVYRNWIGRTEALLEEELRKGPAELTVLRGDAEQALSLAPQPGCAIRARLARSDQRNAYADGRNVVITTKLLEFVPSDDELAFVIGHEAAHNLLDHKTLLDEQKVPTGILKSFGKNASRIRATEEEADRFGARLAWTAGFDPAAALSFWQRYYAKHDPPFQIFRTHPSLKARTRLMRETIAALEQGPQAASVGGAN